MEPMDASSLNRKGQWVAQEKEWVFGPRTNTRRMIREEPRPRPGSYTRRALPNTVKRNGTILCVSAYTDKQASLATTSGRGGIFYEDQRYQL